MPLPLPDSPRLGPPDRAEAVRLASAVRAVAAGPDPSPLQDLLLLALMRSMTGNDLAGEPLDGGGPDVLVDLLADRDLAFRGRLLQICELLALVRTPVPRPISDAIRSVAESLQVRDGVLDVVADLATGSRALAAFDFGRNGYEATLPDGWHRTLGATGGLSDPWQQVDDDPALAARWVSLGELPAGTIGRRVHDFYIARGFAFPGQPDSAPPLLAQHDWVHVLADYGTTVENELEVFAFISRANDDPAGFSLLAMVVSLFETGALPRGAGLFEADAGHLSRRGMADRLADAMRRGALTTGSHDFMHMDWFAVADLPVAELHRRVGITGKDPAARAAGSVSPWEPGGISPFQLRHGRAVAEAAGRPYDAFGATAAP